MRRVYRNQPLCIWVIGALVSFQLRLDADVQTPTFSVAIDFIRGCDRVHAIRLFNNASTVPKTVQSMELFEARSATAMEAARPVGIRALRYALERIAYTRSFMFQVQVCAYDARTTFSGPGTDKRIALSELCSGDLVLLECNLYSTKDGLGVCTADFVVDGVFLLAKKPRAVSTHSRR